MIYKVTTFLLLSCATANAASVFADPKQIAGILSDEGYKAKIETGGDATKAEITSATSGLNWGITFYGCQNKENCVSVEFHCGFDTKGKIPLAQVNKWNGSKRFLKARIDDDSGAIVEMDVQMKGGVTAESFKESLAVWNGLLGDFTKDIGWE